MAAKCFKIKCLTNLHVGDGDVNFNIIDGEVERDPVTELPTINSSGVKGALKEFYVVNEFANTVDVFGKESTRQEDSIPGKLKILSANMLAIPMRATNGSEVYYLVSNECAVNGYNSLVDAFGAGIKIDLTTGDAVEAEGLSCNSTNAFESLGLTNTAIMSDENFKKTALPVIARNCLDNGLSKNLWYEEIVPHESVFYFFVLANNSDNGLLEEFAEKICSSPVQFGGNASIGYGLCKITEIKG